MTLEPSRLPARFWWYAAYTALNMTGFATFAVLAYHLQVRHVVAQALKRQTGARGLNSLLTGYLENAAYEGFHNRSGVLPVFSM